MKREVNEMDFFVASIFYLVAIIGLCAFAIDEALTCLKKRKKTKDIEDQPVEDDSPKPPGKERLDTEGLEVRPLEEEEASLMMQVVLSLLEDNEDWEFDIDKGSITNKGGEEVEIPWICRMIRKRIVAENLKIKISQQAYFILMIVTESNPGKAMFTLHKIGNFFERRESQNWLVTSQILMAELFPFGIPTEEAWGKWWDGQKTPPGSKKSWSDNMVDMFPDEWRKEPIKK